MQKVIEDSTTDKAVEAAKDVDGDYSHWQDFKDSLQKGYTDTVAFTEELENELTPSKDSLSILKDYRNLLHLIRSYIFIPYYPAFHSPGWLLRYILGPHDKIWLEDVFADVWAGITVALTLIPQGLAYSLLANLPPINGLYSAIMPSFVYTFFGSSLQLAVGPVAVVSLLTGQLVAEYVPDWATNPEAAINFAGTVALCMGITLVVLSIVRAGSLIRFVSHPVMSGFTSGAAVQIALNQMKNAFGFGKTHGSPLPIIFKDTLAPHAVMGDPLGYIPSGPDKLVTEIATILTFPVVPTPTIVMGTATQAPQLGDEGYDYAYQVMGWFRDNWTERYPEWTGPVVEAPHLPHDYPITPYVIQDPEYVTDPAWKYFLQSCKIIKAQMYSGQSIRNGLATKICWVTFSILVVIALLKLSFKSNERRKKSIIFKSWQMFASLSSFIAIIVCANIAWRIKKGDHYPDNTSYPYDMPWTAGEVFKIPHDYDSYTLKVVGRIVEGGKFFKIPDISRLGEIYGSTIKLTLIAFMESYAVARKIAASLNQLHILDANQELWANGAANLVGSVSSAFPVAGSFSRSSLNYSSGAKTPLSKLTTMFIVVIAVTSLTKTFEFIPNAALAAVILVALINLFGFHDFWVSFKHSKKDFITMLATCLLVIIYDTSVGLVAGLGVSLVMYVIDISFSKAAEPVLEKTADSNQGVDVVLVSGDLTFFTSTRLKIFFGNLANTRPEKLPESAKATDKLFAKITSTLDETFLDPKVYVEKRPVEIVIKLNGIRVIDLTGLETLAEIVKELKVKNVKVSFLNIHDSIVPRLRQYGITAAPISAVSNFKSTDFIPESNGAIELTSEVSTGEVNHREASYVIVDSEEQSNLDGNSNA